jgi:hypothetical protein
MGKGGSQQANPVNRQTSATDQGIVATEGSTIVAAGGRNVTLGTSVSAGLGNKSAPASPGSLNALLGLSGGSSGASPSGTGGGGTNYTESGAVSVASGGKLSTGLDFSGASVGGDVTLGDTQALEAAYSAALDAVQNLGASSTQTLADVSRQSNSLAQALVDKVISAVSGAATEEKTGGTSAFSNPLTYVALAALGVTGLLVIGAVKKGK